VKPIASTGLVGTSHITTQQAANSTPIQNSASRRSIVSPSFALIRKATKVAAEATTNSANTKCGEAP